MKEQILKNRINHASETGKKFAGLFYESLAVGAVSSAVTIGEELGGDTKAATVSGIIAGVGFVAAVLCQETALSAVTQRAIYESALHITHCTDGAPEPRR